MLQQSEQLVRSRWSEDVIIPAKDTCNWLHCLKYSQLVGLFLSGSLFYSARSDHDLLALDALI